MRSRGGQRSRVRVRVRGQATSDKRQSYDNYAKTQGQMDAKETAASWFLVLVIYHDTTWLMTCWREIYGTGGLCVTMNWEMAGGLVGRL